MRRSRLIGVVVASLFAAAASSLATADVASAAVAPPGPPLGVHATSIAGTPGVSVSWSAPASDGGSPILYYLATTYNGQYFCVSSTPGSGGCHIDRLRVGAVKPSIRVRAVNGAGRGALVVILPQVLHGSPAPGSGTTTPAATTPSGTTLTGVTQTASASTPASGLAGSSRGAPATAGGPTVLPFTGGDVGLLLILGVTLTVGGLLLLGPPGRRRARGYALDWWVE